MRRADRLFQIISLLRTRRLSTAASLARELEVSTRTVYRDVEDLIASGVPIVGEAGVGYQLQKGFELRPMTFTVDELHALVLGARLVQAWADPDLGVAIRGAMSKIELILPEALRASMLETALFGPPYRMHKASDELARLRRAIMDDRWVNLEYVDALEARTERTVIPLGLYFWGKQWLLAAYCWLRGDYRTFRVDRAARLDVVPAEPDRLATLQSPVTLEAYIRAMEARHELERAAADADKLPRDPGA